MEGFLKSTGRKGWRDEYQHQSAVENPDIKLHPEVKEIILDAIRQARILLYYL